MELKSPEMRVFLAHVGFSTIEIDGALMAPIADDARDATDGDIILVIPGWVLFRIPRLYPPDPINPRPDDPARYLWYCVPGLDDPVRYLWVKRRDLWPRQKPKS